MNKALAIVFAGLVGAASAGCAHKAETKSSNSAVTTHDAGAAAQPPADPMNRPPPN